jgi:16S rRNA (uracil1498-N3)-methyltransferase
LEGGQVSLPLFLVEALPDADRFVLDGPEGHHAADVQRLAVGEGLLLGDGRGGTATAVVLAAGRGRLELRLESRRYAPRPDPQLIVVQGIAKGDRGELAVQAMTEVGVDAIVPWSASRSVAVWRAGERGDRARQRWVDTAREAAKQSRRAWVPPVTLPESTAEVGRRLAGAARALVLHEDATRSLATVDLPAAGEIALVIGPEGGIAPAELAEFEQVGAVPVRLGEAVLRTSTAGPATLAVLSVRLGRW